jgi:hypothetical protein
LGSGEELFSGSADNSAAAAVAVASPTVSWFCSRLRKRFSVVAEKIILRAD